MLRRFLTADVFTDRMFGGNPVAVVLDTAGLGAEQMQALATEFNYSETTFILPPSDSAHTAHVRIFTPAREVPFAGHPNIGTAFVLARQAAAQGQPIPKRLVFEEAAGLVAVDLLLEGGMVVGAELTSPQTLSRLSSAPVAGVAACLGLDAADIRTHGHTPQVISVGLPFLVAELASREALRRVRTQPAAYDGVLPRDGAAAIYAYTKDADAGTDIQARMFMARLTTEDPATGSATAAVTALLAELGGVPEIALRVGQGVDMGRSSLLLSRAKREDGGMRAYVGGRCMPMFEGSFDL